MQIQHEACLIEPSPLRGAAGHVNSKSLDLYCLQPQLSNCINPTEHLACCPVASGGGSLLAVHMAQSNQILLFDTKTRLRRDKFPLKAYDKKYSRQSFQVSGMDFSPDGQKLAIGQTDCIIYIYKLAPQTSGSISAVSSSSEQPATTGVKTTISGKFASASPISCLLWSDLGILFGSQDGKVRLILSFNSKSPPLNNPSDATTNQTSATSNPQQQPPKVVTIFSPTKRSSMAISLSYRAPVLLIGQLDCSMQVLIMSVSSSGASSLFEQLTPSASNNDQLLDTFNSSLTSSPVLRRNSSINAAGQQQVPTVLSSLTVSHTCPVAHVCLVQASNANQTTICCSGSDGRIVFHLLKFAQQQQQQSSGVSIGLTTNGTSKLLSVSPLQTIDLKEDITAMDYSHVNECLALATRDRLLFIRYDQEANSWRLQSSAIEFRNVLTLSKIKWLRDGAQLAVGCSNNSLELFKCTWSKQSINDNLDICHIARNRIRIIDRERNLLATYKTQHDIKRVNLLDNGQSVLIWTSQSLLLAKLNNQRLQSEIKWPWRPEERQKGVSSAKFLFDPQSSFVLIHHEPTGELQLLRLGSESQVFYSAKFPAGQPLKRDRLSLRQFPPILTAASSQKVASLSPSGDKARPPASSSRANSAQRVVHRGSNSSNTLLGPGHYSSATIGLEEANANQDSLVSNLPTQDIRLERFAYVQDQTLTVIDLTRSSVICTHKHREAIEWIRFSHTGSFLAFRDSSQHLHLFEFKQQNRRRSSSVTDGQQDGNHGCEDSRLVSIEESLLLDQCEPYVDWLPDSDSLVAQSGPTIYLWYDLRQLDKKSPTRRSERFDSRTFNFLRRLPLIDLSLIGHKTEAAAATSSKYPTLRRVEYATLDSPGLLLSNGQFVQLDRIKTIFYTKLTADPQLESALELLDGQQQKIDEELTNRSLYHKLGWLALEFGAEKCQLAWRIFSKLRSVSLAKYLERCLEASEPIECELMLAKLRGDWKRFERLARDQEEVAATYRRLSKWSLLIDYLERKQQFRQRDLAQSDHLEWLISRGRYLDAAKLRVRGLGDLAGALELLLKFNQVEAAAELLLREQKLPLNAVNANLIPSERRLRDLTEDEILTRLVKSGQRSALIKAGQVSETILANPERALSLYLEAEEFELALKLTQEDNCKQELKDQTSSIHLKCADFLRRKFTSNRQISAKRALKAIDHYLKSDFPGGLLAALEMANLLKASVRGHQILVDFEGQLQELKSTEETREKVLEECRKLGELLLLDSESNRKEMAIKALELGEDYEKLIKVLIELGQFERAFDVSLKHLNQMDLHRTEQQFIQLAKEYQETKRHASDVEQIYLIVQRPDLAIEMYAQLEQHDKWLQLIEQHQPDQLEGSLLQLARSLESTGRLEEAEKYLLRASGSEWTNVVRMYRLARRWPDAYRVARANCLSEQDPLLVQLAYWWAKSLATEQSGSGESPQLAARALLEDLQVLKQVVEFACEAKNFQFALDLLGDQESTMRPEVVLRFATFLEQQHKFERAEQLLVENDLCELAARMYLDNDQHQEAIRVIEGQLGSKPGMLASSGEGERQQLERQRRLQELLNSTLVECAQRLAREVSASNSRTPHLLIGRSQSRNSTVASPSSQQQQQIAEKLQTAQQMLLRAQRPELAIEMYQALGMWQEAIQVAQRFAPRLLESVEQALDEQVSEDIEPILRETRSSNILAAAGDRDAQRENLPDHLEQQENGSHGTPGGEHAARNVRERKANGASTELATWRQFEFSFRQEDWKGARLHFDKFLSSLAIKPTSTDPDSSMVKLLRHLEKFLLDGKQSANSVGLLSSIVQQQESKLVRLVDSISSTHFGWSGCQESPSAGSNLETQARVWLYLRNILACCLRFCQGKSALRDLERRFLLVHYVTIYNAFVQYLSHLNSVDLSQATIKQVEQVSAKSRDGRTSMRDLIDLLCKLSFSLLRFIDSLDVLQVFYVAGLWQLAYGKTQLTRLLWGTLVELADESRGSTIETKLIEMPKSVWLKLGKRLAASLPELARADLAVQGGRTCTPRAVFSTSKLNQVRQWLLETLIEGGQSDARMLDEWPPTDWLPLTSERACLVCGLPLELGAAAERTVNVNNNTYHNDKRLPRPVRREELVRMMNLCEIKSDKAANINQLEESIETFMRMASDKRRATASCRPAKARVPASSSSPRDQLSEIVEFVLAEACGLFVHGDFASSELTSS